MSDHYSQQGLWGPVTSTLDWCEANYQFSYYIAEMANTLSSLVSVSIYFTAAYLARRESLPIRYFVGLVAFALVGMGSFAFHATLLYQAQLADELPMIFAATYVIYLLLDIQPGPARPLSVIAPLVTFDALFSWSYIVFRNPVYHQVVFGLLTLLMALRTAYLLRTKADKIPETLKRSIPSLFWAGSGLCVLAFVIWNLDNIFCDVVTRWKSFIGWPVAFLLEGHSWWHILTGLGSYLMFLGVSRLNLCLKEDYSQFTLGYMVGLPYIQRVQTLKME